MFLSSNGTVKANTDRSIYQPSPKKEVEYNWGNSGPPGMPVDNFEAIFDQSGSYSGDYFVQTHADDGIRVEADGKLLIDRWSKYTGSIDKALWLNVPKKNHAVKTHYFEGGYGAAVFSHVVPLDSWLAYYYPNQSLSGMPTSAKVISPVGSFKKLYEDHGTKSPGSGIPTDHFSARYTTAKKINAGEYIVRVKADDGARVYIDGKLVIDQWKNGGYRETATKLAISDQKNAPAEEKDIHWIEVQYYDYTSAGKVEFSLEPVEKATENTWLGEFYSNSNFEGNPIIVGGANALSKVHNIQYNWGNGSPLSSVPTDYFTARFTKVENFEEGTYLFNALADDGVRVYIDNKLVLDAWPNSDYKDKKTAIDISKGKHEIVVEYYEKTYAAYLTFNYTKMAERKTEKVKNVQYNWGNGSPSGMPVDNFTAKFDQSGTYSGDYFIQSFADDGIKVEADGKFLIDRWGKYAGSVDRALWLDVSKGTHNVKTHYFEGGYGAGVFSHIVPLDTWLAYYYPNQSLSGMPVAAKVLTSDKDSHRLYEDHGTKSPSAGVPADRFSAKYTTAKRVKAGEYIARIKADDGARVYVDGKLVIDQWSNGGYREKAIKLSISDNKNVQANEKDIHWIEVQYYDYISAGKVDFSLEPVKEATEATWLGEYYPSNNFKGTPAIVGGTNALTKVDNIHFNWGNGSPLSGIPTDHFSARFTKEDIFEEGTYLFNVLADDGVRVYLDDKIVLDAWPNSDYKDKKTAVDISQGRHKIVVEYYEKTYGAYLTFNYTKMSERQIEKVKNVEYNWGNSGPLGMPTDNFTALFDQSGTYNGDYFIQSFADDGIKVEADGKLLIDRWGKYTGSVDRALWLGVSNENHTVKTHYFEGGYGAGVFSHVVPLNSWLAYYYPNKTLEGMPTKAKVIQPSIDNQKLVDDIGNASPGTGVPTDNFSTLYSSAQRLKAGDYVLRGLADDGIRVYVDGELVIDRWTNSAEAKEDAVKVKVADLNGAPSGQKDIHWIEVEHYDNTGASKLEFSIQPFEDEKVNTWIAEFYPNDSFTGTPYVIGGKSSTQTSLTNINFDWGNGTPHLKIPKDNFTAKFTKTVNLETGTYIFSANGDDGVRVYLDNKVVLNAWPNTDSNGKKEAVFVSGGEHTIVVDYFEKTSSAYLAFDYKKIRSNKVFYQYAKEIQYNWGSGGPANFPADGFEAVFDQSQFLSGDYFIQTFADGRVSMDIDGQEVINRTTDSNGQLDQVLLLGKPTGNHEIETTYYEEKGNAMIFSNIELLDTWIAYYYPNKTLTGQPVASKSIAPVGNYKALVENNGTESPVVGKVPTDNFSAVYRTAKRLAAGDYILRAKSDDGIRVYVDGKPVLDRWVDGTGEETAISLTIEDRNVNKPNEKNIHWIEVHYYDGTGASNVDIEFQPIEDVYNTDHWVGFIYPTKELTGNPVILGGNGSELEIKDLNFTWGYNSPHKLIPLDNFSARYVKKTHFDAGNYQIKTVSDDGIRVYVDGIKKIDSWIDGGNNLQEAVFSLSEGVHEVVVEYYDNTSSAQLNVDIISLTTHGSKVVTSIRLPVYRSFDELSNYALHIPMYNPSYTRLFELHYGDNVTVVDEYLYASKVRTEDGKQGWVHKDYLENSVLDDSWIVKEGRVLRGTPSASGANLGSLPSGAKVSLLEHVTTIDKTYSEWYKVITDTGKVGWIWGASNPGGNEGYNVIKYEFEKANKVTNQVGVFTPLYSKANVTADQINRFISLKTNGEKTVMTNMGYAYLKAQEQTGVNAIYLLAHSGLETGWGKSAIVNTKYNFYGIGAIDSKPAEGAYDFNTPEGGIIAGASWIKRNYIDRSWDTNTTFPYSSKPTLDNMRNDNSWHQYATDEAWAVKIAYFSNQFYQFIGGK
ncbi:beta-N-acetylglucosaminidase/single-stranded DNA-binding protein/SH3-like domain-containing protein [Metabacillus malikii]|uniref:Beta-N-acetylglucosaminidase/single-stranded DNA-binding protein/SH3-like domain-containing protein n=2 Tax=Metabacillus malikii TaxID=1504265 RepID=A0ABT9ZGL9_9BACI|nr:beta-N-acetylglucosaminidase/single-stranded DNA-binding protein/SH3-like domain-containing protein [Metabacillus malikii]